MFELNIQMFGKCLNSFKMLSNFTHKFAKHFFQMIDTFCIKKGKTFVIECQICDTRSIYKTITKLTNLD